MRRLWATLALTVLLAPLAAQGESDAALWRFVSPNAKALIGIDWARIRPLKAGAMIREQWLTAGAMANIQGLDLLNDIDRVLISSAGKNSPDDSAESPILIAVYGHFDAAKVRQVFTHLGAKPQAYNSFQVYRPQGKQAKDMAYVLFDETTILFGDSPSVFAALDRNQFGPALQPLATSGPMLARAAEMEAGYDFWAILDATEIISNDSVANLLRGDAWASEAKGFEAGVNLRAGLAADITVRFPSDAVAKRVTTELTRVINLAAKDKSSGAEVQNIARKIKFSADGSAARVSLRLTEIELQQSAVAFAASRKAEARNAAANIVPTPGPAPAATPAKPSVIRIEGLDEGTREIPFQDPQQH